MQSTVHDDDDDDDDDDLKLTSILNQDKSTQAGRQTMKFLMSCSSSATLFVMLYDLA